MNFEWDERKSKANLCKSVLLQILRLTMVGDR
jgi:uncharacterized DUF497 family protein